MIQSAPVCVPPPCPLLHKTLNAQDPCYAKYHVRDAAIFHDIKYIFKPAITKTASQSPLW